MQVFEGSKTKKSLSSPHQFSPFSKADWVKIQLGGLSEWSKVRLSKSRVPQGSVGSNPTVSARNHASSRFFRLLAFLFQYAAKPKPLSIASGIQMCVNVRRSPEVAVTKPFLNLLHGNTVCRGNIEFKHYQTLERFLEEARHSYASNRDSAPCAIRVPPEASGIRRKHN